MVSPPLNGRVRPNPLRPKLHSTDQKDHTGHGIGEFRSSIVEISDLDEWIKERDAQNAEYGDLARKEEEQDALREQRELQRRREEEARRPRPVETGPMEFTSGVGILRWPTVVWDVNSYYADLGIHWSATNRQIRQAYQRKQGYKSERLTYIVKQLLNKFVRAKYDGTQPGSVFFDRYMAAYVNNEMLKDQVAEHGRILTFDDRQGLENEAVDLTKYMDQSFDTVDSNEQDDGKDLPATQARWRWGFYLWRTDLYDTDKLRQWQGLLVEALAEREAIVNLSVGLVGGSEEPMRVEPVGYRAVAFLSDNETPTMELAQAAADRVVKVVSEISAERIHRYG